MNSTERRKMERFTLELEACLSCMDANEIHSNGIFTKNICAGGAFVNTEKRLPVGTDVKMDLILSLHKLKYPSAKQSHITVWGMVIRTDETGMAVCFGNHYKIIPRREKRISSPGN
jgi:Tfp pilus assembly protein PilZ